jgi:hypothetical protein
MHPCASWITLALLTGQTATPPAAAPAPAPAVAPAPAPAPAASDPEARAEEAATLYGQRKYAEAAVILEELWAGVHEPRDLFNAALARLALGHRTHAIHYWETYLKQDGIPADGREQAESRIQKAQAASVAVLLRISPAAVAEVGVTYTLTRVASDAKDARPPVVIELAPNAPEFSAGGRTVYLDPGKWTLKVDARGYLVGTQELTIKSGQAGFPREIVLGQDPLYRQATFQIEPPEAVAAGATVTLQRMTLAAQPVQCPLSGAGACTLRLEPGDWEVTVAAPGYQRYTEKVTLGAQPTASFAVALVPTVAAAPAPAPTPAPVTADTAPPPPEPPAKPEIVPKHVRLKLSTGLIAGGIPLFIGGLALGVTGSNNYQDRQTAGASSAELLAPIRMRTAGIGLVGAAVGLWATGLTAEYDVKPRAWYAELGVGGALLLSGTIWTAVGTARWNQNNIRAFSCGNSEGLDCFSSHRMAAGFFLGAGAALVAGSTLGLLVHRKYRRLPQRAALSPYFAGGGAGLVVQGRF